MIVVINLAAFISYLKQYLVALYTIRECYNLGLVRLTFDDGLNVFYIHNSFLLSFL